MLAVLTAEISLPEATYGSAERRSPVLCGPPRLTRTPSTPTRIRVARDRPAAERRRHPDAWTSTAGHDRDPKGTGDCDEHRRVAQILRKNWGSSLIRGREFTDEDGASGRPSVIVNERFLERFLGETDPIGQRIAVTPIVLHRSGRLADDYRRRPIGAAAPDAHRRRRRLSSLPIVAGTRCGAARSEHVEPPRQLADTLRAELQAIRRHAAGRSGANDAAGRPRCGMGRPHLAQSVGRADVHRRPPRGALACMRSPPTQ